MCVLISSTTFFWNISHSKTNWARYQTRLVVLMSSTCYFCPILMELEIVGQFLWNFHEIWNLSISLKFEIWNLSISLKFQISWKSVKQEPNYSMRTVGRTYRRDEAKSHFSQFCERAWHVNSRTKLVATMVQDPSTVAQLFNCMASCGQSALHCAKCTCVQKRASASVPPVTRD